MDGVSVFVVIVFCTIFHSPPQVSGENVIVVDDDTLRIDCGSSANTLIGKRLFGADPKVSETETIFVTTNSSVPSQLYRTARVFTEAYSYRFRVRKQGRHLIRLYFFPFADPLYDLSEARFSVAAQNLSLSEDLRVEKGPAVVKEYWLNVESEALLLTFAPSKNSFAFVNAIEIVLVPGDLFPEGTTPGALETMYRLNMGNESVSPENDMLWRSWLADGPFLLTQARFASIPDRVVAGAESAAPKQVYETATEIDMARDVGYANLSWRFTGVAPKFDYLFRFHFCNLGGEASKKPRFNLYVNSKLVSSYGDSPDQNSDSVGVPFSLDAVVKATQRDGDPLFVTVGPRSVMDSHSAAFLNGLEIMKLAGSLSSSDGTTVAAPKKKLIIVVGIVVSVAGLFMLAVSALFLLRCRRRRRRGGKVAVVAEGAGGVFSGEEIAYRFPLSAIREATEGFSEEMVIGAGGFGRVYKGVLGEEGTAVAIKRGYTESTHGLAEFRTEIEMLSQFRHRHLVSLIGYCDEQGEMIVIYEHVENGTLKDRLYDKENEPLSFRQRLQICIGSARALHYLHTGTAKPIIHRDVKTANILLDRNLAAKVADFGLSKAGPAADESHVTTAVKGSFGYLDPEYLILQRLTQKSDVYSFGVVLLEVLCGRAVVDPSLPRDEVNLVDWAMKRSDEGQVSDIVDPCLAGQVIPESLAKLWETVEKCLADRGELRPSMGDVLWNLETVLRLQEAVERTMPEVLTESAVDISAVSFGDLEGISMSKVFAQMVKEDVV